MPMTDDQHREAAAALVELHEFDVTMQPGHTVLSGSFIRAVPIAAGDSFVADFGPLGQISFGITD